MEEAQRRKIEAKRILDSAVRIRSELASKNCFTLVG
jgi:hypothetical protein